MADQTAGQTPDRHADLRRLIPRDRVLRERAFGSLLREILKRGR